MQVEKYKYKTRLHALISKGPVPSRRAWQDTILTYLTQNCSVSNEFAQEKKKSFFASPLPINVVPTQSLTDELRTEENGFIPVVLAAEVNCPSDVLAALCHLFPQGATVPYKDGSLSLHLAARQPTGSTKTGKPDPNVSDNLKAIGVLAEAYPMALVARDDNGRTPLHVLLENHAATRHVELIERLGRAVDEKVWRYEVEAQAEEADEKVNLPVPSVVRKKMSREEQAGLPNVFIPASSLAIPDRIFGATPLHYAAKNGAPKEVIAALIKGYPSSVASMDCFKRTPLQWVFGAGGDTVPIANSNETAYVHHIHRSSNIISMLIQEDVMGDFDVATMRDCHQSGKLHRTALHYAIELLAKNILDPALVTGDGKGSGSCLTIKSLRTIINANKKALVTRDALGQTPIHVLFRAVFERNSMEYIKALHIAETGAANVEQPKEPVFFSPPAVLVELLLQQVDEDEFDDDERAISCASDVTDIRGLLPIHYAVLVASSPKVVKILVESNPKSLTQLSKGSVAEDARFIREYYDFLAPNNLYFVPSFESSRTPIHMAFANPYMSRVNTVEVIENLFQFQALVDVKKKEDDSTDSTDSLDSPKKKLLKIDGTIALKMQDAAGDTPLHLAAKNHASLEILELLMKHDAEVAMFPNNKGDLPLHLLLDKNFLFVNADLANAHGTKDSKQDAFDAQHTPEFREKVRELAKKQTIVARLQKYLLCGAIFAPTNGWTSEDDEDVLQKSFNTMKKINLLGMAVAKLKQSVICSGSDHGLNCLQILIAFHAAPYKVIKDILRQYPECVAGMSSKDGYSALDIHCIRRNIPNEVRKEEIDSWKAIKELLFSYAVFPLEITANSTTGAVSNCRKEKELINSFEQQILAEVSGDFSVSYHAEGNHPIDPVHMMLNLLDNVSSSPVTYNTGLRLSDTCMRFWIFLATFVNLKTPSDQYSTSVDRILEKLNFEETKYLVRMQIPSGTFGNVQTVNWDHSKLTIDHYANIYCKFIFHKYFHFAGMYDFAPPSTSSILVHRGRNNESALILATQKNFSMKKTEGTVSDGSWMFDPTTDDVRDRSDYEIEETQVVFKFMTNRLDYERELNWRKEFSEEDEINNGILRTLTTFDPNCIDGEVDKKYAVDRVNKRFKVLPLHSNAVAGNLEDTIDLTKFPYAVVFPFAAGGTLQDVVSHGSMDLASIKRASYQMGNVLNGIHNLGLVHGSFSLRNIFSFLDRNGGIVERHLKVGGLTSLTPVDQDMFSLGAITPGGKSLFDSSSLPPEMFMKVNATELQEYNLYWKVVMELDYVSVPAELVKPRIDPITNEAYIMKCYCNLDGRSAEALPSLPYELVQYDESIDVWAFGVFLFNLVSGGETIFQPNFRTGRLTSMEVLAKWDVDIAESIISQFVNDLAAQDLLLHILVEGERRKENTMETILAHPFFSPSGIGAKVEQFLVEARDERDLIHKVRRKQQESEKVLEEDIKPTHLGRLGIKTQLRFTNSATEALRECFDPTGTFSSNAPFTYILLPYQLIKNEKGRLVPKTKMEMELAHRLGRQLLELAKAVGFAACYSETLTTRSEKFQKCIASLFLSPNSDPVRIGKDILSTFMLDGDDYFDIVTKFVIIVLDEIKDDPKSFIDDPMSPIYKLISRFATSIVETFTVTNRAFLYLVDEYSCTLAMGEGGASPYPHAFRDHLADIVYKSLPYMHTCVSSVSCAEEGPRGLLKLLAEGTYPDVPESWENALSGIPTISIRRRMVAEAKILHEVAQNMIGFNSPVALNKEAEMQFLSSLYLHIDSACNYAGLRPITDGAGSMWVTEQSKIQLLEESAKESRPERVYEIYAREEAEVEKMEEKERKIAQLEKALRKTQREMEKIRVEI